MRCRSFCASDARATASVMLQAVRYAINVVVQHDEPVRLYRPRSWRNDPVRRDNVRIPRNTVFKTEIELALNMINRATRAWHFGRCGTGRLRLRRERRVAWDRTVVGVRLPLERASIHERDRGDTPLRVYGERTRSRCFSADRRATLHSFVAKRDPSATVRPRARAFGSRSQSTW